MLNVLLQSYHIFQTKKRNGLSSLPKLPGKLGSIKKDTHRMCTSKIYAHSKRHLLMCLCILNLTPISRLIITNWHTLWAIRALHIILQKKIHLDILCRPPPPDSWLVSVEGPDWWPTDQGPLGWPWHNALHCSCLGVGLAHLETWDLHVSQWIQEHLSL